MNNIEGLHWLGHASVRIDDGGRSIYIDPWKLPEGVPPADLILISHAHYDHCSPDDVRRLRTQATTVCAPADAAAKLGAPVTTVKPGDRFIAAGWHVEAIPAYNIGKDFHQKGKGWVGYIVTLADGRRVYHAGDTDATPELRRVRVDVAFVPCGGTYTMTADEAAIAAAEFKPGTLIPMHWGDIVGTREDAERLKSRYPATVILGREGSPATPRRQ